jgi:hypothetical protein
MHHVQQRPCNITHTRLKSNRIALHCRKIPVSQKCPPTGNNFDVYSIAQAPQRE